MELFKFFLHFCKVSYRGIFPLKNKFVTPNCKWQQQTIKMKTKRKKSIFLKYKLLFNVGLSIPKYLPNNPKYYTKYELYFNKNIVSWIKLHCQHR